MRLWGAQAVLGEEFVQVPKLVSSRVEIRTLKVWLLGFVPYALHLGCLCNVSQLTQSEFLACVSLLDLFNWDADYKIINF